jgi:hypothetical protein
MEDKIFHYTSVEGAFGILESKNLFATDIRYLNDISELDHFKGFILQRLNVLLDSLAPHTDVSTITNLREFSAQISYSIVSDLEELFDIYTVSFSVPQSEFEAENGLLSQWRSYGVDGGVILEFDRKSLVESLEKQASKAVRNLYKYKMVTYGDDVVRIAEMEKIFQGEFAEAFESFIGHIIRDEIGELNQETVKKELRVP